MFAQFVFLIRTRFYEQIPTSDLNLFLNKCSNFTLNKTLGSGWGGVHAVDVVGRDR